MTLHFITFEFPLNEPIRHLLKCESLFFQFEQRANQDTVLDSKYALKLLIDIFELIEKYNLKYEILKEIDRHIELLEKLHKMPTVNRGALFAIMEELDGIKIQIEKQTTTHDWVNQNFFLSQCRYRMPIPCGDLNFDLPLLHRWTHQPYSKRKEILTEGISQLTAYKQAVSLILHLTRESTIPTVEMAKVGGFKKNLNTSLSSQLIRIVFDARFPVFPQISANAYQILIRFFSADFGLNAPQPYQDDVPFELTCCMI